MAGLFLHSGRSEGEGGGPGAGGHNYLFPSARMLVSAFHHDDDLREAVTKASKALNILMPLPKKDEEDKGRDRSL